MYEFAWLAPPHQSPLAASRDHAKMRQNKKNNTQKNPINF